ncbi:oxygen-independent coproporphyrinogen III oxidase [Kordiimonas aquimaris]|uniref:oxygen-independent coproporphyrinogen III oxidase n=1 Tax=Kordiimonas aquimaris TaxID=707591 RepID=UPI0021D30ECE|nr:oxygen-independent coproporphyrinogen III oxidase [Kordiimonas aquimaris]
MQEHLHCALLKHNQQTPRYTSYPTTPNFTCAVGNDQALSWLKQVDNSKSVSLYFHIPFCKKLCWYCGCNTKATRQYNPVKEFLIDLKQEISLVSKSLKEGCRVSHIHFGGGSPSYLSPSDFAELVDHLHQCFYVEKTAEFAIELDPRETTEAKIAAYAKAGVNRASLGVQDFNTTVQKAINRVQPFHRVYETVQTLKSYGITAISFDLLYGLPHQTKETILETVDLTAAISPDRVSLFGYAHVPWMKKHMRLIDETTLPNADERLQQFDAARCALQSHGYKAIGLDHFAKPSDKLTKARKINQLSRNFQGYTTDDAETLIGFGPSAISTFRQGYTQNTPDQRSYSQDIKSGASAVKKGILLTDDDRIRRDIISRIMCFGGVNLRAIEELYSMPANSFSNEISRLRGLEEDGLARVNDQHISVNANAAQAARLAASCFDTYLRPTSQQHSQVA